MKNLITLLLLIIPLFVFSQETDFSQGYEKSDSVVYATQYQVDTAKVNLRNEMGGGGGGGCAHAYDRQTFVFNTTFFNFSEHGATQGCYTYFALDAGNSATAPHVVNIDEGDSWQNGDVIIINQFGLGAANFGFRFVGLAATDIIHPDGTNGSSGDLGAEPTYRVTSGDSNQQIRAVRSNGKWIIQDWTN